MGSNDLRQILESAGHQVADLRLEAGAGGQTLLARGTRQDGAPFEESRPAPAGREDEAAKRLAAELHGILPVKPVIPTAAIDRLADRVATAVPIAKALVDGRKAATALEKATALADRATAFHARFTAGADALMARYDDADRRQAEVFAKHDAYNASVAQGLDAAEAALDRLTNSPL